MGICHSATVDLGRSGHPLCPSLGHPHCTSIISLPGQYGHFQC